MNRRLNWRAGLAAAYAGLQVKQAIYHLVAKVLLAGPTTRKLSEILRSSGYWVIDGSVGPKLVRHVRSDETRPAEPIDLLVIDATTDRQAALDTIEAVRIADWALPIIAIVDATDDSIEEELRRFGTTAWFDENADASSIRTAILSLVPPIAQTGATA